MEKLVVETVDDNKLFSQFLAGAPVSWLLPMPKAKPKPAVLKGWKDIAQFLGQPTSTAQRWTREGMPVERERWMVEVEAEPDKLNQRLARLA